MWNALHPIVLPAMLITLVPDTKKNTYLGLLTFAGLVIAMIIQPLFGAISDRWQSRHGRRRPLMIAATIVECVFLLILGSSGGLFWLCVGYIGLQVFSNAAQAPLQGLLRDRVPHSQLGVASSIKILLDLLGLVVAGLAVGRMLPASGGQPMPIIILLIGLLLSSAAITIFFTPERPTGRGESNSDVPTAPDAGSDLGWKAGYLFLVAERALFLLGIYGLQAFGQYYLGDVLHVADPARRAGDLLASVGAGTVVLVAAGAWLMGRLGAKRLLYLGLRGHRRRTAAREFGGGDQRGDGLWLPGRRRHRSLSHRELDAGQPAGAEAQSGRFLGLTNFATAGSAAVARLQGPGCGLLQCRAARRMDGLPGIFVLGAVCVLASSLFLTQDLTKDHEPALAVQSRRRDLCRAAS